MNSGRALTGTKSSAQDRTYLAATPIDSLGKNQNIQVILQLLVVFWGMFRGICHGFAILSRSHRVDRLGELYKEFEVQE